MTRVDLNPPAGFTAESDLRGGWRISRDGVYAGCVFPVVVGRPEGGWFARLPGKPARQFGALSPAVEHITSHVHEERR